MKRNTWLLAPLAAVPLAGLFVICSIAIPVVSDVETVAEKPQHSDPPRGSDAKSPEQSADKPADRTGPDALEQKWKKVLADWHKEQSTEPADNSFCYVCHVNYEEEKLVRIHQPVSVGCETCHGMSDKHSEDEDNITPPDIMFPKKKIVTFCTECHEKEELLTEEDHVEFFANKASSEETCMDCHGKKHRLKVRTRKWDKATGELIWDDGVRMMEENKTGQTTQTTD